MTIGELKRRKKELGYTNQQIADLAAVPLGTVQKIFSVPPLLPVMKHC